MTADECRAISNEINTPRAASRPRRNARLSCHPQGCSARYERPRRLRPGRQPWEEDATQIVQAISSGRLRGFVAGHSITTLCYLVARAKNRSIAGRAVSLLLGIMNVVTLAHHDFQHALTLDLRDFEDAVQAVACQRADADMLVTRDARDFARAPVETCSPKELRAMLDAPESRHKSSTD